MTVLVDTSVWIRFLANRNPYAEVLDTLLADNAVAGHELVYGELLVGDRGGRHSLLGSYERLAQLPIVPHCDVVAFIRARRLHGRGIGWIDAHLLASALVAGVPLLTADAALARVAEELRVGYHADS